MYEKKIKRSGVNQPELGHSSRQNRYPFVDGAKKKGKNFQQTHCYFHAWSSTAAYRVFKIKIQALIAQVQRSFPLCKRRSKIDRPLVKQAYSSFRSALHLISKLMHALIIDRRLRVSRMNQLFGLISKVKFAVFEIPFFID